MRYFTIIYKVKTGYGTQTFLAKNMIEAMWCLHPGVDIADISSISSREATAEEIEAFEQENQPNVI